MTLPDDRYRRGIEILRLLCGEALEQSANKVAEIAPDFARMTIEFPFGDLYTRGAVDLRTREIAAIAALAALGGMKQLRVHVGAALHLGCAREELIEILMQTAIYAGFPRALDALAECHDLLAGPEAVGACCGPERPLPYAGFKPPSCPPSARDSAVLPG